MPEAPAPPPPASRRDWAMVAITALVGLLVSALAYRALNEAERLRRLERSQAAAARVAGLLDHELSRSVEAVRSAGLLVETQASLSHPAFLRYAEQLAGGLPGVRIVEWQPWVPGSEREAFERSARAQGLDGYRLIEPTPDEGGWLPAPAREHYVPVLFGWPYGQSPLGFNLAASPVRMASKLEAARLRRPVASASFVVLRQQPGAPAVRGFAISAAVGAERQPPLGFVAAVLELPALLRPALLEAAAAGLRLALYEGKDEHAPLLFGSPAAPDAAPSLQHRFTLRVAEHPWTLVLQPAGSAPPERLALGVLLFGLGGTSLLALFLRHALRARRLAESARGQLAVEQQRLANVLAGTRAATWEIDLDARRAHVNEFWERLGGHPPGSYRPDGDYEWRDDCHPEDQECVAAALHAHLKGQTETYEVEYRHRHLSQGWIWVQACGRVLKRDASGRARLMAGTLVDIQARKQAEAALRELNATLELRVAERGAELTRAMESLRESREELAHAEARATLSTLIASMAHELNSPLGNGLICSQNLVDEVRGFKGRQQQGALRRSELEHFVEQVRENAELTQRNLSRASELITRFRQVAADQASEQRRRFDLATMLAELLATLQPMLQRQPHAVHLQVEPGLALDSYPGPLAQVVVNLLNNALAHAFAPGQVGEVRIEASAEGAERLRLCVRDNGRGMDEATRARLFQPYFSTRIGAGGTGLGMAIVDNLVRKTLGGEIAVYSQPGAGSRFEVSLPRQAPQDS